MDEFDEITANERPEPNIGGSFDCQWCAEEIHEAYFDPSQKVIIWWCSKGHESIIDKVKF